MLSIPNDINHFLWWDDHGAHGSGSVGTSPNRWLLLSWPRCADVLIAAVPGVRMANWIPEYPSSGRSKTKKSLRCLVSHPFGKRWVCLKIGYIPSYSHLIGIMTSKTIGYNGVHNIFRHTQVKRIQIAAGTFIILGLFFHQQSYPSSLAQPLGFASNCWKGLCLVAHPT